MADTTSKARVYRAADAVDTEGRKVTVTAVREAASVSNADATRFLREWREDRAKSGSAMAAMPPKLVEQAQRIAADLWREVSTEANAAHDEAQRAWELRRAEQDAELDALGQQLDEANEEAAASARARDEALLVLTKERDDAVLAATAAREELDTATEAFRATQASLHEQLAEARGRVTALEATQQALLERIPAAPSAGESS
jgi:chromosome segregation ATPase